MSDLNRLLQSTFLFSAADLKANRQGKLSARQQAVSTNLWLAVGVFFLVMLGSLGVIVIMNQQSGATTGLFDSGPSLLIIAAVVGIAIVVGDGTPVVRFDRLRFLGCEKSGSFK
jgi:hypothetical protein